MSEENVEIVRRFADAYVRGDVDGALALFDPQIVFKRFEEAAVVGHEAARASLGRWEADWKNLETIPEDFIDAGDQILVPVLFRGRGQGSGVEVEGRYYEVVTVRDGRIVHWEEFSERSDALAAAGLEE
jgi:ketosteroid isomerase-like protein